jgi:hypothetical protein
MEEVIFGGSRVGQEGIQPDVAKIMAVADWPVPANLLELMRFLGLTGYFRALIKDYACLVLPLTDLLQPPDTAIAELQEHFKQEPLFLEVIAALLDLDSSKPECKHRRARHRAIGYMIEEGRLWCIADGKST